MASLQDAYLAQQQQQQGQQPLPEEMVEGEMESGQEALDPGEELDGDIGFGLLASLLYDDKTAPILEDAFSAPNPGPAIAQILAQAVDKISVKSEERGMPLSPRIWLSKGGVVDRALDELGEIADSLGVNFTENARSAAFGEVIDALKLAKEAETRGQQGGATTPPPMPQMAQGEAPIPPPVDPNVDPAGGPMPMEGF